MITLLAGWAVVVLYWVVPLLTVTQALVRWGALCEHKYNLDRPSVAESSPIIVVRWWERLLLPNLNFSCTPTITTSPAFPSPTCRASTPSSNARGWSTVRACSTVTPRSCASSCAALDPVPRQNLIRLG